MSWKFDEDPTWFRSGLNLGIQGLSGFLTGDLREGVIFDIIDHVGRLFFFRHQRFLLKVKELQQVILTIFNKMSFLGGSSCRLLFFHLRPSAWLGQSPGLGPQAQRTNLALWDAWEEKSFNSYNRSNDSTVCWNQCCHIYLLAYIHWNYVGVLYCKIVWVWERMYWQLKCGRGFVGSCSKGYV